MLRATVKGMRGEFTRFVVVGIGATLLHLLVYWGLNELLGITEAQSLALSCTYAVGYLVSFAGNYLVSLRWTFRTQGSVRKGMGFALSHAVNAGLHLGLLNLFSWFGLGCLMVKLLQTVAPWLPRLLPLLGQPESLLPLPVYVIVVPTNFLLVRFFLRD